MFLQRTLRQSVEVNGIGLHSGKPASVVLRPAPPGSGVHVERVDLESRPSATAHFNNVHATARATTIGNEYFTAATVEHCLSVFSALRIDNAIVELRGPEVPIGDGSAAPFLTAVKSAGVVEQEDARRYFFIKEPVRMDSGDSYAYVVPYNGLRITCTIDFPHPSIGKQTIDIDVNEYNFETEIAKARTFGFLHEVEKLKAQGLVQGASLENAIGLDANGILNPEGLRYADEFVRHKVLDALGDLTTLGAPLLGHLVLYKAGHDLMNKFVRRVKESTSAYEIVELGTAIRNTEF
ncbi:MAG: UDP-3-O-acyl-N-acetylglucosamine deacetylase [Bdellovibrionales bacterium]|nr:UDP-3-O-acyl-N-acetylglucosamine deacetylase [Bdellovibrionales bacterium]